MASAQLDEEHWRKNGQWFSLTRPLAELVVADQDLAAAFKRCGPGMQQMPLFIWQRLHGMSHAIRIWLPKASHGHTRVTGERGFFFSVFCS